MFKKIRRYLLFLFMFTVTTANIVDCNVFAEEETLEVTSIETSAKDSIEDSIEEAADIEVERTIELAEQAEFESEQVEFIKDLSDKAQWYSDFAESTQEVADKKETINEPILDTSLQSVSSYIYTYKKLPPLYITKKEAQSLGWIGGSLAEIDCKKSIGGDYFGNYQGLLPRKDGRCYWECDIDTLGTDTRGTKRLVYSNDGLMFYTEDHYATFQMLNPEFYSIKNQIL